MQAIKNVPAKSNKAGFTIHEDQLVKEKNAVLKAIPVDKPTKTEKLAIKENKENAIPDTVVVLPRQPLKELPCLLDKEEKEDDVMSEGSTAYEDDLTMTIEKSILIKDIRTQSHTLFDMDEYRDDIFNYLLKTEVDLITKTIF